MHSQTVERHSSLIFFSYIWIGLYIAYVVYHKSTHRLYHSLLKSSSFGPSVLLIPEQELRLIKVSSSKLAA